MFLSNYVEGGQGHDFLNFYKGGQWQKILGNPVIDYTVITSIFLIFMKMINLCNLFLNIEFFFAK